MDIDVFSLSLPPSLSLSLSPDVCVSLSAREISSGIQLQAARVQAMYEYTVLYIVPDILSFIYTYIYMRAGIAQSV